MPRFNVLWRFVVDAVDEEEAQATAAEVARLAGVEGMPPVSRYEEPPQWMTDHVVIEEAGDLPALFGRCLARAGRLGNEWTASALSSLADGGECFATFNASERNRPAVAGLKWALVEVWATAWRVSPAWHPAARSRADRASSAPRRPLRWRAGSGWSGRRGGF